MDRDERVSLEMFMLRISSSLTAPLINFLLLSSSTRTFHYTREAVVSARGRGEDVRHSRRCRQHGGLWTE